MLKLLLKPWPWIALGVVVAGVVLIPKWEVRSPEPRADRLMIEQIQGLSNLVSARVQVADVMLVDQHGLTGGVQVAAVIRGDYLLATDLSQARFEQVDSTRRRALLVLTPPIASSPRVDLEHSRLFALSEYGLWQVVPGDKAYTTVVNNAYQRAQAAVVAASADPLALQQARRQAENVLVAFLRALGWQVTVRWLDQPTTRSTSSLLLERAFIVSDTQDRIDTDRSLAELRSRLAERIGFLAARRWLRDHVPASPRTDGASADGEDDGDDAQRILSYNARIADDADEHRK